MPQRWFLRAEFVRNHLDRLHYSHGAFAASLGISRSYWSQLLNGHRALTPKIRRAIVESEAFWGVDEAKIWARVPKTTGNP